MLKRCGDQSKDRADQKEYAHPHSDAAIVPAQANCDSNQEQKIADSIGHSRKPCSAWRFRKRDLRQHSIHFVEQAGNVEKEGAEHRPEVTSVRESDG